MDLSIGEALAQHRAAWDFGATGTRLAVGKGGDFEMAPSSLTMASIERGDFALYPAARQSYQDHDLCHIILSFNCIDYQATAYSEQLAFIYTNIISGDTFPIMPLTEDQKENQRRIEQEKLFEEAQAFIIRTSKGYLRLTQDLLECLKFNAPVALQQLRDNGFDEQNLGIFTAMIANLDPHRLPSNKVITKHTEIAQKFKTLLDERKITYLQSQTFEFLQSLVEDATREAGYQTLTNVDLPTSETAFWAAQQAKRDASCAQIAATLDAYRANSAAA
jgi:hypothetical protein